MSCYLAELDFPHLGGVSEQTNKMVHERAGHIHEVACAVQPAECGVRPQVATYPCQGVGEVRGQPGISRIASHHVVDFPGKNRVRLVCGRSSTVNGRFSV
jgi:hypothetical protein